MYVNVCLEGVGPSVSGTRIQRVTGTLQAVIQLFYKMFLFDFLYLFFFFFG